MKLTLILADWAQVINGKLYVMGGGWDVRAVRDSNFVQVTFRLPDNLPTGTCQMTIKAHSQTSNTGSIRIAP